MLLEFWLNICLIDLEETGSFLVLLLILLIFN